MNERIREFAEQAGMKSPDGFKLTVSHMATFQLEKFAELIAAEEREACAEICACEAQRWGESPQLTLSVAEHWMKGYEESANSCAEKIRARGDA